MRAPCCCPRCSGRTLLPREGKESQRARLRPDFSQAASWGLAFTCPLIVSFLPCQPSLGTTSSSMPGHHLYHQEQKVQWGPPKTIGFASAFPSTARALCSLFLHTLETPWNFRFLTSIGNSCKPVARFLSISPCSSVWSLTLVKWEGNNVLKNISNYF